MKQHEWWKQMGSHAKWRLARKDHKCGEQGCRNVIAAGTYYFDTGELIEPATFLNLRLCAQCANIEC